MGVGPAYWRPGALVRAALNKPALSKHMGCVRFLFKGVGIGLLGLRLNDGVAYPVADALTERGIPFVWISGESNATRPPHNARPETLSGSCTPSFPSKPRGVSPRQSKTSRSVCPVVAPSVSDGARAALTLSGGKRSKYEKSPRLSARWGTSTVVAAMPDREVMTRSRTRCGSQDLWCFCLAGE